MKNINFIGIAIVIASLTACANTPNDDTQNHKIGMANPASKYCVDSGGKLEIKTGANGGQVGYCHLADGQTVEEWENFRKSEAKCLPEQAQKLIGQSGLTDDKIKQLTKSEMIRKVGPNQPVTMDYRENRITVTTDPQSKVITHAACG